MRNKNYLFIFLFFFILGEIFSQDEVAASRSLHRLAWESEYAIRYEIIIQRRVFDGSSREVYVDYFNDITTQNFIEISLPVGQYRFRVIPFDMLEHEGEPSNWAYVQVLPIVRTVQAQPEPEILIESEVIAEPEPEPKEPRPPFDPFKPIQVKLTAAWMPILPAYGSVLQDGFLLPVAGGKLSIGIRLPSNFYIGPEFTSSLGEEENYYDAGINIMIMKWTDNKKVAWGSRFGVSTLLWPEYKGEFSIVAGGSFHWYLGARILLETGFDYVHLLKEFPSGVIQPWIGLGFFF